MTGLIIALDYDNRNDAMTLMDQLNPEHCALKVGNEMFTRFGPDFIKNCIDKKFSVFLDLKFHDIPNTVARSCKAAADLGVWMLNVHASGGLEMMLAAKKALECFGNDAPLLIAVTVLTSMSDPDLSKLGVNMPMSTQVYNLAISAEQAGLDGVVCSAQEAGLIKAACKSDFIAVTPGIRLEHSEKDDQSRIMTPTEAIAAGSDYLVIGRPITRAANPKERVLQIIEMMG